MSRRLLLALALSASVFAFRAFADAPFGSSNAPVSESSRSPDPKTPFGGDPVGYIDGNVYESVVDLRVSCPDIDLVFRRAYGSWLMESGPLGYGWTHGYDWRLSVSDGEGIVVVRAAGEEGPTDSVHTFPVPDAGKEVFNADGYGLSRSEDGLRYTLVTPTALSYAFGADGRLSSIASWNGTRVTLEREALNGRVSRVVHDNGKALGFEYGVYGGLVRVTTDDPDVWVAFEQDESVFIEQESVLSSIPASLFPSNLPHVLRNPVLLSAVRHDGALASTNTYVYTNSPPGVRWVLPSATMHANRDGEPICSQPPPRKETVTKGTRPLLSFKTDANGVSSQYWYIRPGDSPEVQCLGMEMSEGLFRIDLEYGDMRTRERKPVAGGVAEMELLYDTCRRETMRRTGQESRAKVYSDDGDIVRETRTNATSGAWSATLRAFDGRHRVVSSGAAHCAEPTDFTTLAWDDRRNIPRRIVTPEGRVREWTEDGHDVTVHGAGTNDERAVTRILCATNDRPYALVSPGGGRTDFSYDADGYVSRIELEGLPSVSFTRDALGRVASAMLPGPSAGRTTSFVRNWRGRPLSVSHPDGTSETFAYDGNGTKVVRHVDALGQEDTYQWILGLPVHAARVVDGATNALFSVRHDEQLNVVAITDPLGRDAEAYVLDENERIVSATNVEGLVMFRSYALGDKVSSETRFDGTEVSYGYDAAGNLASVAYPDETLDFSYDRDGLLVSASNVAGTVSNVYDAATGWLASSRGADGTEASFAYSPGGDVTGIVSVAGTTSYVLDKADRRVRVDSPAGAFGLGYCQWNGKVSAVTNANGLVTTYAYDIMDRVTNIAWRTVGGTPLGGFAYSYDATGRIVERDFSLVDPSSPNNPSQPSPMSQSSHKTYSYDSLDRLAMDGDVSYAYDSAGNRTAKIDPANGTTLYTLGLGDRLATYGRARSPSPPQPAEGTYAYDTAGNVTRIVREDGTTLDLTWNGQYQLVSVSTNGVFAESYAYDALGRRVSTTTQEGTIRHIYDDNWQCIADIDENNTVVCSYVWGEGIDNLLAVKADGNAYYPLTDIQGTVWGYVDSANNIVARFDYDAWGNILASISTVPALARNRYRFQGREWSAATGLTNFRMRWYDVETGRWLSKDPIGLSGGLNYYVFCGNRPIWSVDFSGCCPEITDVKNDFIPEWINAYNEILYDDYGEVLEVSDSCGVVGLCSLAIYGLTSAYTSIVDALAEDQIRTAKLAGVNTKGSLTTKILASDKGMKIAARTQMIKAGLSKVNVAGAVISTAATGFSLGARMNAATRATIRVLSK